MITKDQFLQNVSNLAEKHFAAQEARFELFRKIELAKGIANYYGYRVQEPQGLSPNVYKLIDINNQKYVLTPDELASLVDEPAGQPQYRADLMNEAGK